MLTVLVALSLGADVPVGEVTKYTFDKSKFFPGTSRDYWVYIPKQYDGKTPACVHVNQDGIQFGAVKDGKTAGVFDALIASKKMPVTIGVFIRPGVVKAVLPNALDRFNRSYEYDGLGDAYANFLLNELLPDVETKTATDGRKIVLSKDGNDRSIGGSSSGAIAAFTAAWERPDAFRRVFSSVGTYVGLRGGNEYPTLIRKVEPRPLRIYLEDGSNDLNIYGGDWWMANQSMERSLKFMGYDVEHKWGDGGHNGKHATEIFPEAMTWLWRDYPKPIVASAGSADTKEILIPGERWKLVGEGYKRAQGIAASDKGVVLFSDVDGHKTYQIGERKVSEAFKDDDKYCIQCFGVDGRIYVINESGDRVAVWDAPANDPMVAPNFRVECLLALNNRSCYAAAWIDNKPTYRFVHINSKGEATPVDDDRGRPEIAAIATSPDQSLLYVCDSQTKWVWSYQIQTDGKLNHKQPYFRLHEHQWRAVDASAMNCDRDGRLWVATSLGLQIADQAGRVHCIIPSPGNPIKGFCFGGPDFDTLYCTCGDKVYSRKVKVKGALPFEKPIKPAAPKL